MIPQKIQIINCKYLILMELCIIIISLDLLIG